MATLRADLESDDALRQATALLQVWLMSVTRTCPRGRAACLRMHATLGAHQGFASPMQRPALSCMHEALFCGRMLSCMCAAAWHDRLHVHACGRC